MNGSAASPGPAGSASPGRRSPAPGRRRTSPARRASPPSARHDLDVVDRQLDRVDAPSRRSPRARRRRSPPGRRTSRSPGRARAPVGRSPARRCGGAGTSRAAARVWQWRCVGGHPGKATSDSRVPSRSGLSPIPSRDADPSRLDVGGGRLPTRRRPRHRHRRRDRRDRARPGLHGADRPGQRRAVHAAMAPDLVVSGGSAANTRPASPPSAACRVRRQDRRRRGRAASYDRDLRGG